jgi:vacuolar protein sorting-associated protein 16
MMNPFDDSYQDRNPFVAGNSNLSQSLNPFDSDGVTAAPAVDHYFGTTNTAATVDDDEEDADLDSHEQEPIDSFVSVEASWQYLGDLPYRRIPIYSSVLWETNDKTKIVDDHSSNNNNNNRYANALQNQQHQYGLASFPSSLFLQSSKSHNFSNPRIMLSKTTVTKCVGCPNGGPIAVVTLPLTGHMTTSSTSGLASQHMQQQHHSTTNDATYTAGTVPIRILTVSGKLLSCIDFPPSPTANKIPNNNRQYVPADIFSIGFTNRCILIVITKDSYCFTFNLKGESVLPPFCILENTTSASGGTDLQLAHIYEGGVAVLGTNKDSALVELLDKYDSDLEYLSTVHHSARRVVPHQSTKNMMNMGNTADNQSWITNQETDELPSNFAIVTSFPTAVYATSNACHYCAIGVLPRTRTVSRHPEIFLSTSDHSVIVVNAMTTRCTDVNCRSRISSPIVDMCFAPNGRFLACFTESSMLTVISTSFETKVLDFDTSEGSNTPPLEMKWCGEDSVVLHWKNLGILMVGPYGDWLRFPYQGMENVFLLPEIDCCRVITDTTVEILQRVPPTTALLLRIGSIDAAAMLLDASDSYYAGSPSSSDTTNAITETGMLEEAIEACTDAAMKEFDIRTQKRLLRAASYGMHFSYKAIEGKSLIGGPVTGPSTDNRTSGIVGEYRMLPSKTATKFVDAARSIRILNALRHPNIGFVVTAAQFDSMTPTGVIARLIAMKRPSLASAISNYLHLPKSVQLYARACGAAALIESAPMQWSDSEIAERAIRMINGNDSSGPPLKDSSASHNMNRGGYATVAMTANAVGRPGVANLLLMLETSVADKVPALISTGSYADALAVATAARYDLTEKNDITAACPYLILSFLDNYDSGMPTLSFPL